jgi:hypothetical protein
VAAETEAAAQQEQTERLAPEFEASGGGAYPAAQSVAVEATAAEAAAASKAATAALEDCTPLEELNPVKDSSGGAETTGEVDFTALLAFGVGARVRVLAATAPGFLPRLAVSCGEAIVVAFDSHTFEYTVKNLPMYSRLYTKISYYAVAAVSRGGNEELKTRGGSLSSKGGKAAVQAELLAFKSVFNFNLKL